MPNTDCLLQVENLKTYFPIHEGLLRLTVGCVKAVDGVSMCIRAGRSVGLVGESGCGKTTLARSIVRLVPVTEGRVVFEETDVLNADKVQLRWLRRQMGIIFQDPLTSLSPRMSIGNLIAEPLKVHGMTEGRDVFGTVSQWLCNVGLSGEYTDRYPHELSAGQRQRVAIARVLALRPKLVICDEPVSSLDVCTQEQILNLLKDLQERFGLTYLFISHDAVLVKYFCDTVVEMRAGKVVHCS